jgi:hypothetical protein
MEYHGAVCNQCDMPRWLAEIAYDQDLHVHHLTYASRGNEEMDDLEILCRRCHELETYKRTELREVKPAFCEACGMMHWDYRSSYCIICSELRVNDRGIFRRLQQPDLSQQGQPYWITIFDHIVVDTVLDGATPDAISESLGNLALAFAKRFIREQSEDVPF